MKDVPVFALWQEFTDWILNHSEKFPKKVRFTLAIRIDNLTLDILQDIIKAAYSKDKKPYLAKANLNLNVLRVLLRITHKRGYLAHGSYQHAMRQIEEAGRMIGGWHRSR